ALGDLTLRRFWHPRSGFGAGYTAEGCGAVSPLWHSFADAPAGFVAPLPPVALYWESVSRFSAFVMLTSFSALIAHDNGSLCRGHKARAQPARRPGTHAPRHATGIRRPRTYLGSAANE